MWKHFCLFNAANTNLPPAGVYTSGNPAVWVKNHICMQAAKHRICFLGWFVRYRLDWVSDNLLKHWFEQYGGSGARIKLIKSISLPPPSECSGNINSVACSQHAALGISVYIKTLVRGPAISYSCCSRGALWQSLLKCPSSLRHVSEPFSGLFSAGCVGLYSLAALEKFSFCIGSLLTSGCFQCP